ncbi:MAG: type II toxin-antitoxin system RelE/ParE family toxin [Dyadobacter sp.]|uniref:type II toxin-antitoxin system RelE/ParE family toxin n=1 Tax=Dyadobacter sp. TaxID=1914288 RepID=UPI001B07CB97|nr:type II toxin-antitoxin system RelE/ParE family toxin [Dyadobacter sp.]
MYRNHILRSARKDIREAAHWYNDQKPGLGKRFTHYITKKIELICENPHIYQVRRANMRAAIVPVFPFLIFFNVDEKRRIVSVVGVFHSSLNPQRWQSREQ